MSMLADALIIQQVVHHLIGIFSVVAVDATLAANSRQTDKKIQLFCKCEKNPKVAKSFLANRSGKHQKFPKLKKRELYFNMDTLPSVLSSF